MLAEIVAQHEAELSAAGVGIDHFGEAVRAPGPRWLRRALLPLRLPASRVRRGM